MDSGLSIVILTFNQADYTLKCLRSLRGVDAEIILVDNGSDDGTDRMVRDEFPEVIYIRNERNLGVAAGRNVGLRAASGRWLMLLDNDTEARPGEIMRLLDYLQNHSDVGLVAPALRDISGNLQDSFKSFPGLTVKIRNVISRREKKVELPADAIEPFYVIGACQMFTREVYKTSGGLDEKIFFGPEDADFCMEVRRQGKRVVYLPDISVTHHWQRATTRRILSPLGRMHIRALIHFYVKHRRFL